MSTATRRLMQEWKELTSNPPEGIIAGPLSEESLFLWEACIAGPPDTPYEHGVFQAKLTFPENYPLSPPKMVFTSKMWHPNVYSSGEVCISILHPPGDDPNRYEAREERWSPVQSIEKILISVMSMLSEPNDQSPANLDAAIMWRNDREKYNSTVDETVRLSLGLVIIANHSKDSNSL